MVTIAGGILLAYLVLIVLARWGWQILALTGGLLFALLGVMLIAALF